MAECAQLINYPSAAEKTGKFVASALKQLDTQLGIHALVLIAYRDTKGEVKISEYVYIESSLSKPDTRKGLNPSPSTSHQENGS